METQFDLDNTKPLRFNDKIITKGYYNLVVSIRDVSLFTKGMKPHRHWYLKDVKRYFGLKGNTVSILKQLKAIQESFTIELENK